MKIAVIIDTWFPHIGGGQINAWEISRRLASKGLQIDIITRNNGQDNLAPIKNLQVIKLGRRADPFDNFSKLAFLTKSFLYVYWRDYDLVHAHAFLPGLAARLLMVFKSIPAIFTVHGTSISTDLLNPFSRFLEKFILNEIHYSAQITVSRDFLKIKNINKNKYYVPNGVDIDRFDNVNVSKAKQPTMIFVGRLHPQKNLTTLILAITQVKKEIPDIRLRIVGNGPQREKINKLIKQQSLESNIELLGEIGGSSLVKFYKSSHLFILPSIYEGQPLTLLEGWAAKLPVVVTKTGDCQFLVKNGHNGYLINNPHDTNEIARVINKALISKSLEKLGLNGYNLVKENFSWEKSAKSTLALYKQMLHG